MRTDDIRLALLAVDRSMLGVSQLAYICEHLLTHVAELERRIEALEYGTDDSRLESE